MGFSVSYQREKWGESQKKGGGRKLKEGPTETLANSF